MNRKYKRVLIANRGEIAVRINRACHEMGIETVAIHSQTDQGALHTRVANYTVCVGERSSRESYLNSYHILSAAIGLQVDAIHPGIGYYAENADFAKLCSNYNIDFIGPGEDIMRLMGNKVEAKKIALECGVSVAGGNCIEVNSVEDCINYVDEIGLPIILKAVNGGGGKGIRIVYEIKDIENSYEQCKKEAEHTFGDNTLLIEKYLEKAKHVEVQVLGDKYGNILCLGDRECSIQRANQKIIEEARCQSIAEEVRANLYNDCIKICQRINYCGPGTFEFLYLPDGTYYFMEMNTRLQVEHPITEMATGIDLVVEQIRVAQGFPLQYKQEDIVFNGYALECRILAEYFHNSFIPSFGTIQKWLLPGGPGVRIDTGYGTGDKVTLFYDSLLAKICCHGKTKKDVICKMICCLNEAEIEGIQTNIDFLKMIITSSQFASGNYNTSTVDEWTENKKEVMNEGM